MGQLQYLRIHHLFVARTRGFAGNCIATRETGTPARAFRLSEIAPQGRGRAYLRGAGWVRLAGGDGVPAQPVCNPPARQTPEEGVTQSPTVVSMLICDQVIDDKITNKKSAVGIFNIIMVPRVPTTVSQMAVMISMTEIGGPTEIELRLIQDTDNAVLFDTRGLIAAPDPLATVDLIFGIQGLKLPKSGQHAFEVLCNGEILARRRFHIRVMNAQDEGTGEGPTIPGTNG